MTTPELSNQLRAGQVSREGFRQLWDAECYGNAASLGALKKWLHELELALGDGRRIEIEGAKSITSQQELVTWIAENFPSAHACFYQNR